MRYGLRTLHVLLAAGPPLLAALWFLNHSIVGMIGWLLFTSLFVIWYLSLLKSQSMDPRTRGTDVS